jgi:hypothetical protein
MCWVCCTTHAVGQVRSLRCVLCVVSTHAEETSKRIQKLLSAASSKGICGKGLMAAAAASLRVPADVSPAAPGQDKLLVSL